jgi:hypothetical protein
VIRLAPPRGQGVGELLELMAHAPLWLDARATRALRACRSADACRALTAGPEPHRLDLKV